MKIKEVLQIGVSKLDFISSRHLESRILLSKALNKPIEYLLLNHENNLLEHEKEHFFDLIARRKKQEPIAYIIGSKEFYGREFYVNKDVLIPRPDTEVIIESVIAEYNKNFAKSDVDILDLGTGSGAIAITLALEINRASITAVDNSEGAIEVASQNIRAYNLSKQINLIKSNWYDNLTIKKYDFIVSNPPYIDINEQSAMSPETVIYEPKNALYAANKGLAAYEYIIKNASKFLKENGLIFLEVGYNQSKPVSDILENFGFAIQSAQNDIQGHVRVIIAIVNI